jgi:hypothetical protein
VRPSSNTATATRRVAILLCLVAMSAGIGAGCKRRAASPTEPAASTGSAAVDPKVAAAAAAKKAEEARQKAEDDKWFALKQEVKNWKPRFESAMAKLDEAMKIKTDEYEKATDPEAKKAALAKIKKLKNEAGDIYDALRFEADQIQLDKLWANAFKSEAYRWDQLANRVKKGLPRF